MDLTPNSKFDRSIFIRRGRFTQEITGKEIEAITHSGAGGTARQVGLVLNYSHNTIEKRFRRARDKAGASKTVTALIVALLHADEDYRAVILEEFDRLRELYRGDDWLHS